jgi:DNA modification methylase
MIPESRDKDGKLKVGYYKALGLKFKAEKGYYQSDEFKTKISHSGILHSEDWLPDGELPDACVDLIYIDPPFNSNRNYEVFWGETREKRAFEDRHESTRAYPAPAGRPRCVQLARVLKKTGSFYYHCDWHASHYVKVMLDQIFGENNFQNEIYAQV